VVVALQRVDGVARQVRGVGAVALIVRRLPAAGLVARYVDEAAGVLEQAHGGEPDRWPEQIDQTAHEQRDARRRLFGHVRLLTRLARDLNRSIPAGANGPGDRRSLS